MIRFNWFQSNVQNVSFYVDNQYSPQYNVSMDRTDYDHDLLTTLRNASGMTQEQVASEVGVKRLTIIRVEQGECASYELLKKLTRLYGKPITSVLRVHDAVPA